MVSDEPLKWRKYLLLVKYGLLSLEELSRDIRRYPSHLKENLVGDLTEELAKDRRSGGENLYVVKLVPKWRQGQLPNLRINRELDLNELAGFWETHRTLSASEVWYCRTHIAKDVLSVAGRISFNSESFPRSQVIEQVWRCSPRLIESFGSDFPYPYIRASRCSWGWHYYIDDIYLNKGSILSVEQQRKEFYFSVLLLERMRENVERFLSYLELLGQKSVSLEYKIISNQISIIDWDTANDWRVLTNE